MLINNLLANVANFNLSLFLVGEGYLSYFVIDFRICYAFYIGDFDPESGWVH